MSRIPAIQELRAQKATLETRLKDTIAREVEDFTLRSGGVSVNSLQVDMVRNADGIWTVYLVSTTVEI
jgi:hypothetical protein